MDPVVKVIGWMIGSKGSVWISMLMEIIMKGSIWMENNKALGFIYQNQERSMRATGPMG